MSSKKLISRIYIYTKSLIFWAYNLWKYISELFYLLDPCMYIYIYGFLHFQWYILFDEEWISTKSTISYQYIHQRRNHHWYHWSVGIFYLLVSCIYIYRFSAPSMDYWLLYPTKNELLTFQLMNLGDLVELHILSMKPHKNCFIKKWISLEYSICWFHVYIYRFSASSMDYWLLYPTKNNFLTFELVNLGDLVELHILSMKQHKNCFIKKWISLVSLVCWNILSGGWEMLKVWFWKNSKI